MRFSRCGIHGFHETLGIDSDEIRFYWAIECQQKKSVQVAYRIVLATDAKSLELNSPNVDCIAWDSGRVESHEQRNVVCRPFGGFQSTCSYFWRVTVWNEQDEFFHSPLQTFFTAYPRSRLLPPYSMNQTYMPHSSLIFRPWFEDELNRWKAVWIGDGGDKPIYLRKSFELKQAPTKAVLFASGLGHFNMSVNGRAASDHRLDPGWTNYHRRVQFTSYDVTDHLSSGENVLGAHVGNGFYAGDKGDDRFFWPMYEDNTYVRYGNELCFFCELHLFYEDGSRETHISDSTWRIRKSATTLANIYASETHDRRLFPSGWDAPGFDDGEWNQAKPLTGPRGHIFYQTQPSVVLHDTFHPVKTYTPRPGVVCFDLGQNASTMVQIAVEGETGSEVIVRYAETVNQDGTVLMPDPIFKEFETGVFSKIYLAGSGEPETWEPDFSFTSARYIQVEGVSLDGSDGRPVIHSAIGRHISSAARNIGALKTDKEDVNDLLNALKWTFSSNLFSYHTDCPQIEKFGWLEVTHLLAPATQYVRDMESLYTKILDDILDAQEPSGLVPTMAPEIRYMCGPLHDTITWGCAICLLPDILLRYYGSTHVIPKVFPAAVRYMEYMRTKERNGGLIEHGLGDWGRDIAFGNHQANIETAIYYRCEMAEASTRGMMSGLLQWMLSWGYLVAQWLGYGCSFVQTSFQWRFPLAFQWVPGLILATGVWFLNESPRWLMEKDRHDEALAALQRLHGDGTPEKDQYVELEFQEIRDAIEAERASTKITWKSIITKPSWRRRLVLGCGVQAFGPLSGINVINYYGTRIYGSLGINNQTSLMIIGISGALSIVWCTGGLWALERVGRIKPLIIGSIGMAGALVANAAMSQHYDDSNGNQLRAMVAMNFVFSFFYTFIGIISWVYPAEIFPVDIRNQGNSITTFTNWTINLVFAQFTPKALTKIGFRYFYVFFCFNLIATICYALFFPETRGKTLEQMDLLFGDSNVPSIAEDKLAPETTVVEHIEGNRA